MTSDSRQFSRGVNVKAVQIVARVTQACVAITQDAYADLTRRAADGGSSPVASGRFTGSMRVSINSIDASTAPADASYDYPSANEHQYNVDNLPGRTIRNQPASRAALILRGFKLGDKIYISNSVPYARKIEVGGHSWQTPKGAFRPSMAKMLRRFQKAFKNTTVSVRHG